MGSVCHSPLRFGRPECSYTLRTSGLAHQFHLGGRNHTVLLSSTLSPLADSQTGKSDLRIMAFLTQNHLKTDFTPFSDRNLLNKTDKPIKIKLIINLSHGYFHQTCIKPINIKTGNSFLRQCSGNKDATSQTVSATDWLFGCQYNQYLSCLCPQC